MITPPAIPPRNPASRALPVKNALHAKSDKVSCRVAIIGAGLAGLSAADHLVRHGIEDIVVLEARQRVGGRIHTVKHNGKPLELGSQWIHGGCPANSVFNLANRFKILGREVQRLHEETEDSDGENVLKHWPTAKGYIYKPDGLPMSCSASNHAYEIFNNILEEAEQYNRRQYQKQVHPDSNQDLNRILKSTRMSTFYNGRKRRALESLRKTPEACSDPGLLTEVELALSGLARVFSVESGDDLCKVRLEMVGAKEQLPGGHVMVPKGLSQLVAKLSETLPKDCIKLGHVVKAIDWSLLSRDPKLPDKVTVICKNPGLTTTFNADYVICTIPIGVLKENHDEVFHPKLPSNKVQAIQNIGSGQMGKILLEWQSPWWAPGEGGIQLAWPESSMNPSKSWSSSLSRQYDRNGYQNGAIHNKMDDEYRRHWYRGICNFSEVESQPNLLMCLIAGESSRIADELDDEEIVLTVTDVLRKFTGDPGLLPPNKIHRHTWTTDRFSLGTSSYPSLDTEDSDFDTLSKPLPCESDPRLLFAGEATDSKFWGQMLGARLSGLREAQRVLDRMEVVEAVAMEMEKNCHQKQGSFFQQKIQ